MSLDNMHQNDYGHEIRLTVQEDSVAKDISSYTTLQYVFTAPSGTQTTKTASFYTDGTDGVLTYTTASGLFDETGTWIVQARISKTGITLTSDAVSFTIDA